MARWEKLLEQMVNDRNPIGYTYADAALVLSNLQFTLAARGATSHRKWARKLPNTTVVIGLVEKGKGNLKPYLIRDMISQLKQHDLLPPNR